MIKKMKLIFIAILTSTLGAPNDLSEAVYDLSDKADVDPALIAALVHTETGRTWDPKAYNERSGAAGLMQLAPFWQRYYNLSREELFDPETNIKTGIKIIKHLNKQFSKKCTNYYSEYVCRRLTPLHFYRCSLHGAGQAECDKSVKAVVVVQNKIKRELKKEISEIANAEKERKQNF